MHTEYVLISNSFYKKALIRFLYVPESGVGVLLAKLNSAVRLNGPGSLRAVWIFFLSLYNAHIYILGGGEKALWLWVTVCVRLALYSSVLRAKRDLTQKSPTVMLWAQLVASSFSQILTPQDRQPAHISWLTSSVDSSFLLSRQVSHSPLPSAFPVPTALSLSRGFSGSRFISRDGSVSPHRCKIKCDPCSHAGFAPSSWPGFRLPQQLSSRDTDNQPGAVS